MSPYIFCLLGEFFAFGPHTFMPTMLNFPSLANGPISRGANAIFSIASPLVNHSRLVQLKQLTLLFFINVVLFSFSFLVTFKIISI